MAAAGNIKGENRLRTDPERGIMQADQNRREPMFAFNHFNFNVTDLERSIIMMRWGWSRSAERKRQTAALSSRFWGTGKRSFSWN